MTDHTFNNRKLEAFYNKTLAEEFIHINEILEILQYADQLVGTLSIEKSKHINTKTFRKRPLEDFERNKLTSRNQQQALYNKYRKLGMKLQPNLLANDPVRYSRIVDEMNTIRMTLNLLGFSIRGINYNRLTGGL